MSCRKFSFCPITQEEECAHTHTRTHTLIHRQLYIEIYICRVPFFQRPQSTPQTLSNSFSYLCEWKVSGCDYLLFLAGEHYTAGPTGSGASLLDLSFLVGSSPLDNGCIMWVQFDESSDRSSDKLFLSSFLQLVNIHLDLVSQQRDSQAGLLDRKAARRY